MLSFWSVIYDGPAQVDKEASVKKLLFERCKATVEGMREWFGMGVSTTYV